MTDLSNPVQVGAPVNGEPLRRLVTFLGTGKLDERTQTYRYETTRYLFGDSPPITTPFVARALCGHLSVLEVRILATKKAWDAHGSALEQALRDGGIKDITHVSVPEGGTEADLWKMFTVLKEELRPPAGWEVVLDITHGFRCQPFYAAAALSFVRAVEEDPAPVRVFYGSYRPPPNDSSLWDLTPVVELMDWARVLTLFLETGRAAGIVKSADDAGRRLWMEDNQEQANHLRELSRSLRDFSEDFSTVRTGSLLLGPKSSSSRLMGALLASHDSVVRHLPPLADVLPKVEAMVEGLTAEDLGSPDGLSSLGRLANLYLERNLTLEAVTILREAWVSRYADPMAVNPGPGFNLKRREEAESAAKRALQGGECDLFPLRNDLDHAGFRDNPASPNRLRSQVRAQVSRYLDGLAAQAPPSPAPRPSGVALGMQRAVKAAWAACGYIPAEAEKLRLEAEGDLGRLDEWVTCVVRDVRNTGSGNTGPEL